MRLKLIAASLFLMPFTHALELQFTQQSLLEPFEAEACTYVKSAVGAHEFDVNCGEKKYSVHLVLSHYPKTQHGTSAYELLYWVTDFTDPFKPVSDSTTLWIHNSLSENRMTVLEAAQGVQNDTAQLRMVLKLAKPEAGALEKP